MPHVQPKKITITRLTDLLECPECEGSGQVEVECSHRDRRLDFELGPDFRLEACERCDGEGGYEALCSECGVPAEYVLDRTYAPGVDGHPRVFWDAFCLAHLGEYLPAAVAAWLGLLPSDEHAQVVAQCRQRLEARHQRANDLTRTMFGIALAAARGAAL